jgi:oxaloacetate decarboxylase alpha subunit
VPATVDIARIAEELGIPHGLDIERVRELDDYMEWATFRQGYKPGKINSHDPGAYETFIRHQIPGGMISNFRNQLRDAGLMHRIDEVLEEAGRVREELGFPVMVTPFSQFVGVQATFNVIQGERYKTIPREVRLFALGYYGNSGVAVNPNALDRILQGKSEDRMDPAAVFEEKIVDKFRAEHGPFASDEELLLALFYGKPAVQALNRNKSTFADGVTVDKPLRVLVSELAKQRTLSSVRIEKGAGAQRLRLNMTYA